MSQKDIIGRCRDILRKLKYYEYVEEKEDFDFLLWAFSLSSYYEMKTHGLRIIKIQKKPSNYRGKPCFYLIREDGTYTDISYSKIFVKDHDTDDVLQAMRMAIKPIRDAFRQTFRPFVYEGRMISNLSEVDVDHYDLSFKALASIWIESKGGIEELIKKVNSTEDGDTITCFTDNALIEDFREFHNKNTHLRFLPMDVNRSRQKS